MIPTLYVMIGPAGSGKSTFCKDPLWKSGRLTVVVSPDTVRKLMWGDEADQREPEKVFRRAYNTTCDCLCAGFDVIFDATSTASDVRKKLLHIVSGIRCRLVAIYMNTPLEECKRRNKNRKRVVPEEVIERQHARMLKDAKNIPEQFDEIVVVEGWKRK